MRRAASRCSLVLLALVLGVAARADGFDPDLSAKADAYQSFLEEWFTTGLGGLGSAVHFTDASLAEVECYDYQGDSMIWTGSYLAGEAARYKVTGDPAARAEVLRIARYLHQAKEITGTLGYVARYAGPDRRPWNCGYESEGGWTVHGTGAYEGYFWVDHTSRDQYTGWWLGLSMAYDAVDDETMRATIRQDMADVIEMLVGNQWHITDENGQWTGNGAAWVGPTMRLSMLVQTAHVTGDPYYRELLDRQYDLLLPTIGVDTDAFLNKYNEYFGNNLRHNAFLPIFRLWPDRPRLEKLFAIWMKHNRSYVAHTLNPWFDEVHVAGCRRLGNCSWEELQSIRADAADTLDRYWDPPDYKRAVTCSAMPLDPFSVWMDQFLNEHPQLRGIINIGPQTEAPREIDDRHWTDQYWQSTPFEASCSGGADPRFVGAGADFLMAYWMGVYYGLLPGDGPYGDDAFENDAPGDDAAWGDDPPAASPDDDAFDAGPAPRRSASGGCAS